MPTWRRVQRTGGGSLSITLPKDWAVSRGVKEGSTISILDHGDGTLSLVPEGVEAERPSAEISMENSPTVTRDVIGGYLLGFDTLTLQSSSPFRPEELKVVRQTVRRLAGAEIVDEQPRRVVVKVLLDPRAVEPEIVLRRESALVERMIVDSLTALLESNLPLARAVSERDEEVDRQYFTLVRMIRSAIRNPEIAKGMELGNLRLLDLRLAARLLEDSADEATNLCQDIGRAAVKALERGLIESLREAGDRVVELTRLAISAFLAEDHTLSVDVISKYQEVAPLIAEAERTAAQANSQTQGLVSKTLARLEHMAANAYDIAELVSPAAVTHRP